MESLNIGAMCYELKSGVVAIRARAGEEGTSYPVQVSVSLRLLSNAKMEDYTNKATFLPFPDSAILNP